MLGLALAAAASFAMGWLGYQVVQSLRPAPSAQLDQTSITPASAGGGDAGARSAAGSRPPTAFAEPAASGLRPGGTASGLRSALSCLAGSQREISSPADPSNYGLRLAQDWQGRPVPNTPKLIVLHETVVDEATALNLFRRHHGDDGQQASYHVLIGRDGRRIRVVPDDQRAYGAGDSAFQNLTVQLKPGLRPSVNNIALHVSLVSPDDGADGEARRHGGYTPAQYRSLASQIALWQGLYGIPGSQVVTHQEVDRSGTRRDPRSFDWGLLARDLRQTLMACGSSPRLADLGRGSLPAASR